MFLHYIICRQINDFSHLFHRYLVGCIRTITSYLGILSGYCGIIQTYKIAEKRG